MYDILQLNDMLVPELLDIAEQLSIANAKKLDKQELIYKILDKQAIVNSAGATDKTEEKTRRRRVVKTTTANSTEEAIVESEPAKPAAAAPQRKRKTAGDTEKKGEKKVIKKAKTPFVTDEEEPGEEKQPLPDLPDVASEDEPEEIPEIAVSAEDQQVTEEPQAERKSYPQRRDQAFNIEFDGIVMSEGVLESLDQIEKITGEDSANVIGYCLGGTLLTATLSYLQAKKHGKCFSVHRL